MFMISMRKNQVGDTIVEVVIAIAIVSAVLGGAYATSNHSLKNTRQAQEHTVALKYAEAQIEQVKAIPDSDIGSIPTWFWMNGGTATAGAGTFTDGITYTVTVNKANGVNGTTFKVYVAWDSIISSGKDRVSLTYRVNPLTP
jgi:Tfp pilus assembly protein PilV